MRMAKLALAASPISFDVCVPVSTVLASLKSGGAPEVLSTLLEGESLFNDASGLVLFDIFLKTLMQMQVGCRVSP